jgi:DNA-binding transcriptional ArsR family regulator
MSPGNTDGAPFEQADVFWIDDTETFEILGDPRRMEIIELSMTPRSVTEMAEILGVPRTRLYHHINLLERAGIIAVASTRQSGAVTEKLYQATAHSFQPSEKLMETAQPREQALAVIGSIFSSTQADFVRAVEMGLISFTDRKERRRVSIGRQLLRLTPQRLHELIGRVEELLADFSEDDESSEDAEAVGVLFLIHPSSRDAS